VQTLRDVSVGLLQELSHKQHDRGSTVTTDIILSSGSSRNHDGSRVLDLHLTEEDIAVLGELDLSQHMSMAVGSWGNSRG
jgi:hypothetical protein